VRAGSFDTGSVSPAHAHVPAWDVTVLGPQLAWTKSLLSLHSCAAEFIKTASPAPENALVRDAFRASESSTLRRRPTENYTPRCSLKSSRDARRAHGASSRARGSGRKNASQCSQPERDGAQYHASQSRNYP